MKTRTITLLAATAIAAVFVGASASKAQDGYYGGYGPGYYSSPEQVIVTVPRHRPYYSDDGLHAPIVNVSESRPIRMYDLDLRTGWGAHRLRDRIRQTAMLLCRDLDARNQITLTDNQTCYRDTIADAMDQADHAIANARGENYSYGGYDDRRW